MTRMTDERLAEIDALWGATTKGPWRPCPQKSYIFGPRSEMIASSSSEGLDGPEVGDDAVVIRGAGAGLPMDENHDFLVASWQIVKELREEVRSLNGDVTEARDYARALHQSRVLTCVYCGHTYPQDTPTAGSDVLTAHIAVCDKHPMRALEAENARLRKELKETDESYDAAHAGLEKIVALCGDPSESPSESVARVVAELADLKSMNAVREGGFETALRIANGCTDYGGGYGGRDYEIFQHGIGTVITALSRARSDDTQTAALIGLGAEKLTREGCICGEYAAVTGLLHPDCKAHPEPATAGLRLSAEALFGGPPTDPLLAVVRGGVVLPAEVETRFVYKTDPLLAVVRGGVVPPAEVETRFVYKATWEAPDGTLVTRSLEPGQDAIVSDEGVTMQPDEDPPLTELEQLKLTHPKCSHCDNLAVCFGTYEGSTNWGYGCSTCCGHGCEDGHCTFLADDSQIAAETARELSIENDKLEDEVIALKKEKKT